MDRQEFEKSVPLLRLRFHKVALSYLSDENEAEDIVQDTLLKLWMARDKISNAKGGIESLGATIAKNLSIDRLRELKRHPHDGLADNHIHHYAANAQARLEEKENENWIKTVVGALPDKYRAVLQMRQVEQMEFSEIAAVMGTTETSVRTILSRARAKLMEQIKQRRM